MELSSSCMKKFIIFSYISRNGNPPPKKKKILYISGIETLKSFLYFRKCDFFIPKPKKTKKLTSKWNFLTLRLKNFLYFQKWNP